MTLSRIFHRRSRKQLEAEIANLERENELLFETNNGLCEQLRALMVPLPGEERKEGEKWLN